MNARGGRSAEKTGRRTLAGAFLLSLTLAPAARAAGAQNPQLATDFQSIMQWMSGEMSEGLAFHSSVSFAPPVELQSGEVAGDTSFGVGTIPLHKDTFPTLKVTQLQNLQIQNDFSSATPFPDLTAHVSLGLPDRWEIAGRVSDMSVPKYPISPTTTAEGQSNILGMEVRKHLGPSDDRITVFASYDRIFGGFKFYNSFANVPVAQGLTLSSNNTGELDWNMATWGLGFTASHDLGRWVPYYGAAYYYSAGHVFSKLTADFTSQLATPIVGQGDHPINGSQQLRGMFGTMFKGRSMNYFGGVEVLGFGSNAGQAYSVHVGLQLPFGRLWGSGSALASAAPALPDTGAALPDAPQNAPVPVYDSAPVKDNAVLLQ